MVGIIDYGMGNLGSIRRRVEDLGLIAVVSDRPDALIKADKLILPGVGSFAKAVSNLKDTDLWEFVTESVTKQQTPILGICLGMQLMMEYSEEGNAHGFGWFRGNVRRFKVSDTLKYKVPHIGWNTISLAKPTMLAEGIENTDEFYFVHSYYVECEKESDVIFSTTYESAFTSGIQKDNLFGVQFHPEKSHDAGKLMLENFLTKI